MDALPKFWSDKKALKDYGFPEPVGGTTMMSFNDRSAWAANFCSSFKLKLLRRTHKLFKNIFIPAVSTRGSHRVNADVNLKISIPTWCVKMVNTRQTVVTAFYCLWTNPNFPSLRRQGIQIHPLQKREQSLFLPPLPQFPLSSLARSSFPELVFVIRSPARLTEKGHLTVYWVEASLPYFLSDINLL